MIGSLDVFQTIQAMPTLSLTISTQQGIAAKGRYKTRDAAAEAAERDGLDATNTAGKKYEFGGLILKSRSTEKFTYTIPITFNQHGHFFPQSVTTPKGFTIAADYHTHPHTIKEEGEGFSLGDEQFSLFYSRVMYVADTFSRNMYRYVPHVTQDKENEWCCGVIGDFVVRIP